MTFSGFKASSEKSTAVRKQTVSSCEQALRDVADSLAHTRSQVRRLRTQPSEDDATDALGAVVPDLGNGEEDACTGECQVLSHNESGPDADPLQDP